MEDEFVGKEMAEEVRGLRVESDNEVDTEEKETEAEEASNSVEGHSDFVAGTDNE